MLDTAFYDYKDAKDIGNRKLAAAIALRGGQKKRGVFIAPWKPNCDNPIRIFRETRPVPKLGYLGFDTDMRVHCRRCEKCLNYRRLNWRERIASEVQKVYEQGRRSWFVTLTFSPIHLAGILIKAKEFANAPSFEHALDRAAYPDLQRFFDRVRDRAANVRKIINAAGRKQTVRRKAKFRYFAVMEFEKGKHRLHYHVLLHEVDRPIGKRPIQLSWRSFSGAKLTYGPPLAVGSYISKYLVKNPVSVRASLHYGTQKKKETPPKEKGEPRFVYHETFEKFRARIAVSPRSFRHDGYDTDLQKYLSKLPKRVLEKPEMGAVSLQETTQSETTLLNLAERTRGSSSTAGSEPEKADQGTRKRAARRKRPDKRSRQFHGPRRPGDP